VSNHLGVMGVEVCRSVVLWDLLALGNRIRCDLVLFAEVGALIAVCRSSVVCNLGTATLVRGARR
jgi:hypothetical protein